MQRGQKAWEYSHTEHAWPVVHAFMPGSKDFNQYPVLKQKLNLVQQVESNNHLRGGVVNLYNTQETSWLTAMYKMGYRYACVWFDGCWADNHEFNNSLLAEIDRINSLGDWLASGQLQCRDDEYPFFTRSVVVVNIGQWILTDQPNPHIEPSEYPDYLVNQGDWEDSVHSITELVQPDSDRDLASLRYAKQQQFANAWIPWSLRRHMVVPGLSDEFMETVTSTRPLNGTSEFELGITGQTCDQSQLSHAAKRICKRLTQVTSPVYFVNTENSRPEIAEQLLGSGFDQYVGPTAGFKLLYYAHKYGFHNNSQFIFYDFDPNSCKFKQDTLSYWDGEDYVEWVDAWCSANPGVNTELKHLVQERWPTVVDQFGGKSNWLDLWYQVQSCHWSVQEVDLVNNWQQLTQNMAHTRTFFWSSNIYSYMPIKLSSQGFALENSFINIIKTLNNNNQDSWFSGTDINDNDLMCPSRAIMSVSDNNTIGFE